jgi:hypothetical protein
MNDKLPSEILSQIFLQLSSGMLLRCGAVCKYWDQVSGDDHIWRIIMSREMDNLPNYSAAENRLICKTLTMKWAEQRCTTIKQFYVACRRKQKISARVFPKK